MGCYPEIIIKYYIRLAKIYSYIILYFPFKLSDECYSRILAPSRDRFFIVASNTVVHDDNDDANDEW